MRTTKSTVTFYDSFVLNRDVEELPAGSYEIETDEEEILTTERSAFRRTAVYFYVENQGSTRTLMIDPADLESALSRDAGKRAGLATADSAPLPPDRTLP
jgi:hypothetical protein